MDEDARKPPLPDFITLLRTMEAPAVPDGLYKTVEDVEAYLLQEAVTIDDLLELFVNLVVRLNAIGLKLQRASLHTGTLHPMLYGFAWVYETQRGICNEVQVGKAAQQSPSYLLNPLHEILTEGGLVRGGPTDPHMARFPLMAELEEQGITDYVAVALRSGGSYHNAVTLATGAEGGFGDETVAALKRLLPLFGLHVERHISLRITRNIAVTYLGPAAGQEVLSGSIQRGDGRLIEAVIWLSDLRRFTILSEELGNEPMIALLNAYFGCLVEAVMSHGGEVLKFMGDGVLAVFPHKQFGTPKAAANAALAAARTALNAVAEMNRNPPEALHNVSGWAPLRTGIGLHDGSVFFGNVGGSERLDFTVIGSSVNEASRVEALSKAFDRQILMTQSVAALVDDTLDHLGAHALRGIATPVNLYSPVDDPSP
ncbi:MAG: adenylate/guanylate cyclase domain-containing protein [Pseudomonadota bacterium]